MTAPSFDPTKYERLPEMQEDRLTPETVDHARSAVSQVYNFMASEGESIPDAIVQPVGDEIDDAYRDELVRQLSLRFQVDLEAALNQSEKSWKAEHSQTVETEPWMRELLGLEDDGLEANSALEGYRRWAALGSYRGKDYWMQEIELIKDDKFPRITWFVATDSN